MEEKKGKSAKLEFNGNVFEILDFQHFVEDEKNGNPYNCLFRIRVVSEGFSGCSTTYELDYKELQRFIMQLDDLIYFRTDAVKFQEISYGSIFTFLGDGLGHIKVSGTICNNFQDHSLTFEFNTDQTVYGSFIEELKTF